MAVSFQDLNLGNPLNNAVEELGFIQPTPIQELAIPAGFSGKDVVGIAETGTGKTLAYLIPILRQLKYSEQRHPRALVVVPTRELVVQVVNELEKLTKYINVRFLGVYGGVNIKTHKAEVYQGLDVLVGTPGRLHDLYMDGVLRFRDIKKLVIDEVDEMLALGFRMQLNALLELLPVKRQNLLFSATLSNDVATLIDDFLIQPQKILLNENKTPINKIEQSVYLVPNYYTKINLLKLLLSEKEKYAKVLVFCDNKKLADRIYSSIENEFANEMAVIHSNKSQNYRLNAINSFESAERRILIATDIAARGLDFKNVSHVVNFDTPKVAGDYVHRVGRTGRADKQGAAITFVNEAEQERLQAIMDLIKYNIAINENPESLIISDKTTEDEKPVLFDKDYLNNESLKHSQGAFHEKKGKNKKVNLGGPGKRKQRSGKAKKRR